MGAGVSRFPLRPAEALEWRAAMARVDAWKRVQEERRPQLDASSQRRVAPLGFPGGQGLATMLPCALRLCLPQLIAHAQDLAAVPSLSRVNISIRLRMYSFGCSMKYCGCRFCVLLHFPCELADFPAREWN